MADRTVVVLGGGTGGLVSARILRRRLESTDRVVVIDRSPTYQFAASFLWVMTGARRPQQVSADRRRLRRAGIEVLLAEAHEIDLAGRQIKTSEGEVNFDRLVIALGADLAPETVGGFAEAAYNIYTLDGAFAAAESLRRFDGGRVAVMISRLPYKCPAAPYETAFLTEALLRRRKVRDRTTIDIYTPEPLPMPTAGPVLGEALASMLADRGIDFHPNQTIERVEAETKEMVFADGSRGGFDLLFGVPAHRAPAVLGTSGLTTETGFVPVDRTTLATSAEGVFAIGDVTTIPVGGGKFLPKAGVFAEAEARVVARNIAHELAGRHPSATFDGSGACFVELGDAQAAFATGNFYAEEAPKVRLRRPGPHWHLAKVAFEQYWMRRWL